MVADLGIPPLPGPSPDCSASQWQAMLVVAILELSVKCSFGRDFIHNREIRRDLLKHAFYEKCSL